MKPLHFVGLILMIFGTSLNAKGPVTSGTTGMVHVPPSSAKQWTLDDGLTLIVHEDHSSPVASVQAWCETGSINEGDKLGAGMSHILEHMLFKGTATRTPNEIAQKIQDEGGYINAYTSYDRTVFWIDIPSKGVSTAVDILSDAMMNATMPEAEYTKEQEVIRREFAMNYDDPDRMASLELMETAYSTSPYRFPVIGHMEVYNTLTRDQVMAYYKERYVPNNLFFVVVGDVDPEKVHAQVAEFFSKYPRKALAPQYIPEEPAQLGKREQHKEFPTELTRLNLAWHIPDVTHPDVPALDLLSVILGSGRSSRMYLKLREELGLAHSISAYSYTPRYSGLFGVDAVCDPAQRAKLEAAILEMIEDVKTKGVTAAEVEKGKRQFASGQLSQLTTSRGIAGDLGSNWLLTRNLDFSRLYLESLSRVTTEDVKRVAAKYLYTDNLTITSMNPEGTLKEGTAQAAPVKAGEIQKFQLSNGMRLLVREDHRLPLVSVVSTFKAGVLAETPENNGISQLLSKAILKGTKTRTAEQIAVALESAGGTITSDAGNNSVSVKVNVLQSELRTGLDILSDVLLNSTYPQAAVDREKENQLASLKAEEEEVTSVARNLMRRSLFPGHPYGLRALGTPEVVKSLQPKQLLDFHKKYICGKNGVIAVFGAVKADEVRALLEQMLAALPPGEEAFKEVPPTPVTSEAKMVEEDRNKAQAILMVGYRGADMFSPDRAPLEVINEASSDLGSRFFIRIREQMGLAYFVGTSMTPGLVPGPFVFYLGTSPAKLDAVQKEFDDEIGKLAQEGLTEAELARAKEKYVGQEDIQNQSNDALAFTCALDELYGLGFDNYVRHRAAIQAVTLEDTKRVAQKYFAGQKAITAIVRPAPKK